MASRRSAIVVTIGTATTSLSKWFLVWLFAQSAGGPAAVGEYSFVLAFATPLFVLSQLGLRTIFLSVSTRWPWSTYLKLRALGNGIGTVILVVFVLLSPGIPTALGFSIALLKVFDSVLDIYLARVQYGNRMVRLGRIVTAAGLVTMIVAAITVRVTGQATAGIVAAALVSAAAAVWAYLDGRTVAYEPDGQGSGTRQVLTASVPVTTAQLLGALLFQLPVLALSQIADTATIGMFAGAAYLLTAASLAGSTLQTLLITPFRQTRERNGASALQARSARITLRTLLAAIPLGIGVVLLGSPVLTVVYGPGFALDPLPLALLAIAAGSTVSAFVLSVTLTVLNRYAGITLAMGLSCVASAVAGVALALAGVSPILVGTGMSATGATFRLVLMYCFVLRSARRDEQNRQQTDGPSEI